MLQYSPLPAHLSALPDSFAAALPSLDCVSISGDDARTFLHSQLTIDVNKLPEAGVRRSAHCDFKGKSWSVSLVAKAASAVYLLADSVALAASVEQLKKYGVFAKITIEPQQGKYAYFIVRGEAAKSAAASVLQPLPAASMTLTEGAAGFAIALDFPADSYLLAIAAEQTDTFVGSLVANDIAIFDAPVASALDIASGIPAISSSEHINEFVPQMMNLQALNAIDFNKGCYMGQEVVARTRYLGKNKRAAMIFKLPEAVTDIAAAGLEKRAGEHWRSGGTILRTAVLGEETWILAIVSNDTSTDDAFRLTTNPAIELIHCDLPYTL